MVALASGFPGCDTISVMRGRIGAKATVAVRCATYTPTIKTAAGNGGPSSHESGWR